MRARAQTDGLSVNVIAGTHVVLLAMDVPDKARKGLLGFTIRKSWKEKPEGGKKRTVERVLYSDRVFKQDAAKSDDAATAPAKLSAGSHEAPIQSFVWGDYAATPGRKATYSVTAIYGKPKALKPGPSVEVQVRTEIGDDGEHGVFFNRGVAGSQAYARKFEKWRRWYRHEVFGRPRWDMFIKPEDVPDGDAYRWLSRGLEEAMLAFIAQAEGPRHALRGAVYEFTHMPALNALTAALQRGVDVQIMRHGKRQKTNILKGNQTGFTTTVTKKGAEPKVFDRHDVSEKDTPDSTAHAAAQAVASIALANPDYRKAFEGMVRERRHTDTISHNKFLVLLEDGKPVQVWTGSTNFTSGGIYGQSNVGHVIRDPAIAAAYFDYWKQLAKDTETKALRIWNSKAHPDLDGPPPPGVTPIFSPRADKAMLDWYAGLMKGAKESVHFTAAFNLDKRFKAASDKGASDATRYLLFEKESAAKSAPDHPGNRVAWGDVLATQGEEDHIESLTGLNTNVNYLHTKYMLVDPLGDDPIVISGSANFSEASTASNDENMLVIRGNKRVADIFLGEFMRIFNHFRIRNEINAKTPKQREATRFLSETDAWTDPWFEAGGPLERERKLFAGTPKAPACG